MKVVTIVLIIILVCILLGVGIWFLWTEYQINNNIYKKTKKQVLTTDEAKHVIERANLQKQYNEELNALYSEFRRLRREIKIIKDPKYETKEAITIHFTDTLGDTIQVLTPENLIDRLQYLKHKIEEYEKELTPPTTNPEEPKPQKEETTTNANMSNNEIYHKLIKKYGKQQIIVSIEELAELQKELCKHLRDKTNKKAIIEEICDVQIMLEQLILYFDISPLDLDSVKRWKLERTKERMLTKETEDQTTENEKEIKILEEQTNNEIKKN